MYFKNIIFLNSWDFFVILKDFVDIQMSVSKREHLFYYKLFSKLYVINSKL